MATLQEAMGCHLTHSHSHSIAASPTRFLGTELSSVARTDKTAIARPFFGFSISWVFFPLYILPFSSSCPKLECHCSVWVSEPNEEAFMASYKLMKPALWHTLPLSCDVRLLSLILLDTSHVKHDVVMQIYSGFTNS